MNRSLLGALSALLLVAAGLFWWQGRAETDKGAPLPVLPQPSAAASLPPEAGNGMIGPALPEVSEISREQRRFDRLDRDRNGKITRVEALIPRVAQFRKLDVDGNNLLTFEEWAVQTSSRFRKADSNGDGVLDRIEFATTKPKPVKAKCQCAAPRPRGKGRAKATPEPPAEEPASEDDFGPVS